MSAEITVALVTAIPTTIAAVAAVLGARSGRRTNKHIGETNGTGTLAHMLEGLVEWKVAHTAADEERFNEILTELSKQSRAAASYRSDGRKFFKEQGDPV